MTTLFNEYHARRGFAPVAPISVLRALQEAGKLPWYNLVLAHNVVEHAQAFEEVFKKKPNSTIIVDNSVIELGKPVEAEMIAQACMILRRSAGYSASTNIVAVLPDSLLDMKETIEVAMDALTEFRRAQVSNLMFVPQGKTLDEIITCAEYFQRVQEIRWIGVARNFVDILGSRRGVTRVLQSIFPNAHFHMLGFSRNTIDDIGCTLMRGVEGIDSSMPLRLEEPISFLSQFPKRGDWWKEGMECTDRMILNVEQVCKWLGQV